MHISLAHHEFNQRITLDRSTDVSQFTGVNEAAMHQELGDDKQWTVERELGRGSFATVYKLVHAHTVASTNAENKFALKVINGQGSNAHDQEEAFKEFRLMQRLSHQHVVIFLDSFQVDKDLHLVLELCEGGDLRTFLDRLREQIKGEGKVSVGVKETQVMKWTEQLASALQYLHGEKVLHRDLKPQNILLKNEQHLKIGDLGIARQLIYTQEMVMSYKGTPLYMGPEIYKGSPYSYKADIWSLGCCVYEMMSLQYAFHAYNRYQVAWAVMASQVKPLPACYSQELQSLVFNMLDKNPDARPSAAHTVCTIQGMQDLTSQRCQQQEVLKRDRCCNTTQLKTFHHDIANALFRFLSRKHAAQSSHMAYLANTPIYHSNRSENVDAGEDIPHISILPQQDTVHVLNLPTKREEAHSSSEKSITESMQRGITNHYHESTAFGQEGDSITTILPKYEISHDVESSPNMESSTETLQSPNHNYQSSDVESYENSDNQIVYPDLSKLTSETDCRAYAREIVNWARTRLVTLQENKTSETMKEHDVNVLKEDATPGTDHLEEEKSNDLKNKSGGAVPKRAKFKESRTEKEHIGKVLRKSEEKDSHPLQNRSKESNDIMGKNGAITLFTRSQRVTFRKDAHLSQDEDMITDKEIIH